MKLSIGETISGGVTEIKQVNGIPEEIILSVGGKKKAAIPLTELPEKINGDGQKAVRHLARKYMNRKLIGTIVKTDPLTLSYNNAVKNITTGVKLKVGDEVKATVVWTSKNKAELEYHNMPLYLNASEFGWLKYVDLRSALNRGQKIQVKVINITEDGKVEVSHKMFAPNPWPRYLAKYQTRNQYLARVKSLNKVGIVVSLEPGLDILCAPYPFFDVRVNDDVAVEIVDIDPEHGKMKGFVTALANRA